MRNRGKLHRVFGALRPQIHRVNGRRAWYEDFRAGSLRRVCAWAYGWYVVGVCGEFSDVS